MTQPEAAGVQEGQGVRRSRLSRLHYIIQILVVGGFCLSISPLDTRTVFAAASEYVRNTSFGPYDRIVFSQLHRRPFEVCPDIDAVHTQSLQQVERALPEIQATSKLEVVRLFHLIRAFNRASQTFYTSNCPQAWSYYYSYVDYQSWLLKVAPVIWIVEVFHRSEIYITVLFILGSWFGVFCLFWATARLSNSTLVGFASLAALWFALRTIGPSVPYIDFRLNLLNTFALVGIAQFLCDWPSFARLSRTLAMEVSAAILFAACSILLLFPRLPSTRLDATVAIACVFGVAAVRRDLHVFRRAVILLAVVTLVQLPYHRFSARLLGPVSAVNTANADEFKLVNVVQYLGERPNHFGSFVLDFNATWVGDGDYYLRQLSPIYAFHHGFPAWARRFVKETVLRHPTELPNAWWKRFAAQVAFHNEFSFGFYGSHQRRGTAVLWFAVGIGFVMLLHGRRLTSAWPLAGVVLWEVFGLHTFLALMHGHSLYMLKGIPMLWCALPCVTYLVARESVVSVRQARRPWWVDRIAETRRPVLLATGVAAMLLLTAGWVTRELRKEVHATRIWLGIHAGAFYREAQLSPDELLHELDAIRALGGDAPGTVSMYGAWVFFGFVERAGFYRDVTGQPVDVEAAKRFMLQLYRRGLAEAPDNAHFYAYAQYLGDPDWPQVFQAGLERFPEHPYGVMMSWALAASGIQPSRNRELYENLVRRQLRDSASFRPGFRPRPVLMLKDVIIPTDEDLPVVALAGETLSVERFATFNTDRLSIGAFVRVVTGQLTGQLVDENGAHLADLPVMTPDAGSAYRVWHFEGITTRASAGLELRPGPQGARFVFRDLYPLIENPRWFR